MPKRRETAEAGVEIQQIYRNFSFTVPRLAGVNETVAPFAIKDEELIACWNFLPSATGNLCKIKPAKKVFSTSAPIVKMISHILNNQTIYLLILENGSVFYSTGAGFSQIANEDTLSGNPEYIDFAVWQNQRIYVIDKQKGYFKFWFNSNTNKWEFIQVSNEIKGNTILVWQGRVFIGNDSIVQYSVALDPEDFVETGSGYFDLAQSFPTLKLKVKKLISYIDNLFVLGDNAILALTGTTISNDPSNWYLTQVTDALGVENHNLVCSYNNEFWLQNEKGLYKGVPTSLKKFDYKIRLDALTLLNRQVSICQINNLVFYPLTVRKYSPIRETEGDNLLFFADEVNEFYYVDLGFDVYGIYWSILPEVENQIYVLGEDGLYKWGKGEEQKLKCYLRTKLYNLNNDTIEKVWRNVYFSVLVYPPYDIQFEPSLKTEEEEEVSIINNLIEPPLGGNVPNIFGYLYDDLPVFGFVMTNTSPFFNILPIMMEGDKIHAICNFYFNAIGRYCSFILQEEGSTPFEITHLALLGQIGRRVI